MAKKAISKIKIRSTGKTYVIRPEGYDELFNKVCMLCDYYGIERPDKNSQSESTSPESNIVVGSIDLAESYVPVLSSGVQKTISITNTDSHNLSIDNSSVPDWVQIMTVNSNSLKFKVYTNTNSKSRSCALDVVDEVTGYTYPCMVSQDGYNEEVLAPVKPVPENKLIFQIPNRNLKVYADGTYALESQTNDYGVMGGQLFYGIPSNASFNFYMNLNTYELDHTELVNGVNKRYALIPASDFTIISDTVNENVNRLHINYKNGEKESTFVELFVYNFVYDVQNGQLKLYENGYCCMGNTYKFQMFTNIKNQPFAYRVVHYGGGNSGTYAFSDDMKETIVYNGESVELKYVVIDYERFDSPGLYYISIDYQDGSALANTKYIFVYDSQFSITFKEDSKTLMIDRCQEGSFTRQFDDHHGIYLRDYVDIHIGNVIMDFGTVDDVYEWLKNLRSFYINRFSSGSSVYREDGIIIQHSQASNMDAPEWFFFDSTWNSEAIDKIYVKYGNQTFDSMVVRTYDSDPNNIYIKGVDRVVYRMTVGVTYTLDQILKFKPVDANFEFLEIGREDWEDPFWISGSSEYFRIERPTTLPTSWDEFYRSYKITPLKAGTKRIYFTYRSVMSSIGGGGDIEIRINN